MSPLEDDFYRNSLRLFADVVDQFLRDAADPATPRPLVKLGERVFFKPEWMEAGEESCEYIALEDELADRRSLKVQDRTCTLRFVPVETVQTIAIERSEQI